jgi:DNA-binding Lrp family transcriptional regulator
MQLITETQRELLKLLVKNSRWGPTVLSSLMGKSRNWISRSIRHLVEGEFIRAYTAVIDLAQVYGVGSTVLFLRSNPREKNVSNRLLEMPELMSLDGISGEHSLIGHFRKISQKSFEDLLDRVDHIVARTLEPKYKLVQVLTTYKSCGFKIDTEASHDKPISAKDLELLSVLAKYAPTAENPFPLSQAQIGRKMRPCLSQPAVSKAITRLELQKAIVGYSVDTDFSLVGLPIKFFLQVKVKPGTAANTAKQMVETDEVWDLHRTSEDYSLFATVRTKNVESYNKFLRNLFANEDIIDTQSTISFEEWYVPPRMK